MNISCFVYTPNPQPWARPILICPKHSQKLYRMSSDKVSWTSLMPWWEHPCKEWYHDWRLLGGIHLPPLTFNIHFQTLISAISIHQHSQHECKRHMSYSCHLCIPHPALSLSSIMFYSPFNFSEVLCTDSGMSLSALWWLWVLLYEYGTVWNAGCHSWNPLIVLFSHCDPLMEGYKYDRQSSVLILEIQVYTCRIVSSIGGTSRATPSAGFVCIKTPVQ